MVKFLDERERSDIGSFTVDLAIARSSSGSRELQTRASVGAEESTQPCLFTIFLAILLALAGYRLENVVSLRGVGDV
jgi:hypothetical protein